MQRQTGHRTQGSELFLDGISGNVHVSFMEKRKNRSVKFCVRVVYSAAHDAPDRLSFHQAALTPQIPHFFRSFHTSPVFTDENSRLVPRPAAPGIQSSPARPHQRSLV